MGHKKQRFGKATIKSALEKARGNLTEAAEVLGVSRQTVYNYMERYPDLVAVRQDAENRILDIAEGHVEKAVLAGDMDVIKFYLRTKGRARGYVTSGQMTVSGDPNAPMVVRLVVEGGDYGDDD